MRTRLLVASSLLLICVAGAGAGEPSVRWRLGPSDMLRYDLRTVTLEKNEATFGPASLVTVYGHDLRDDGQYLPLHPVRRDLPAVLGLRLPTTEKDSERVKLDLPLHTVTGVRIKGTLAATSRDGAILTLEGAYTFASRGKAGRDAVHAVTKGEATVRTRFDADAGRVLEARVALAYTLKKLDAEPGERPRKIATTYDLSLSKACAYGYDGFEKEVDEAIEKGVAHLRTLQAPENQLAPGSYRPHDKHRLGTTALAVLTLAACGVPNTDPAIEKALAWLERQVPRSTYDAALGILAFEAAYPPKSLEETKREMPDARFWWCEKAALQLMTSHASPGSWGYPSSSLMLKFDGSNTQYAVLALRAASQIGLDVEASHWLGVIRHCKLLCEPKGPKGRVHLTHVGEGILANGRSAEPESIVARVAGFRYGTPEQYRIPRASMTSAAITCLAIAREQLRLRKSKKLTPKVEREIEDMMLGGWAWLDARWTMDRHAGQPGGKWFYYALYSLERAAMLDRVRRVGGKDWYFEGAAQLLARQRENGAWTAPASLEAESEIVATCLALLFLKRTTKPAISGRAPK